MTQMILYLYYSQCNMYEYAINIVYIVLYGMYSVLVPKEDDERKEQVCHDRPRQEMGVLPSAHEVELRQQVDVLGLRSVRTDNECLVRVLCIFRSTFGYMITKFTLTLYPYMHHTLQRLLSPFICMAGCKSKLQIRVIILVYV